MSGLSNGAKVAHDAMLKGGFLGLFSAMDMRTIGRGTQDLVGLSVGGSWDKDPNMYENIGETIADIGGSMGSAALNASMAYHSVKAHYGIYSAAEEAIWSEGTVYQSLKSGGFKQFGTTAEASIDGWRNIMRTRSFNVAAAGGETLSVAPAGAIKGVLKNFGEKGGGKFVAEQGIKRGVGLFAPILLGTMLAKGALGFAGKIVDEAVEQDRRGRMVNYDTRFIRGAQQDAMSNLQLLGAGMGAQQQAMVNTARIYHSR